MVQRHYRMKRNEGAAWQITKDELIKWAETSGAMATTGLRRQMNFKRLDPSKPWTVTNIELREPTRPLKQLPKRSDPRPRVVIEPTIVEVLSVEQWVAELKQNAVAD